MNMERLDRIVLERVAPDGPGVAVAITPKDGPTRISCAGDASLEWRQPITSETAFGLGSVTKPFTAQAIMLLHERGLLAIEDPISDYLPDAPIHGQRITIAQLLTHTSGVPNYITRHPDFWPAIAQGDHTPAEVIALVHDLPLDFEPGDAYSYSNTGYFLLGILIEKVSGMSYGDFVRSSIFEPLGMTHSRLLAHDTIVPQRASGYALELGEPGHAPYFSPTVTWAAGGLGSTLDDLIQWDSALRRGQVITPAMDARMRQSAILNDGRAMGYGLGWGISRYRGRMVYHHAGGVPGFSSFVGRFLDDGLTIIVLANIGGFDASGLAAALVNDALALPEPQPATAPIAPDELEAALGVYRNVIGETLTVRREGAALALEGNISCALVPLGDDLFRSAASPDTTVRFEERDEHGYQRAIIVVPFYWFVVIRVAPEAAEA